MQTNTILRDVSAINGFLDFVVRKGYTAYRIPPKSLPKENRNFKAYIFTDEEIEQILLSEIPDDEKAIRLCLYCMKTQIFSVFSVISYFICG